MVQCTSMNIDRILYDSKTMDDLRKQKPIDRIKTIGGLNRSLLELIYNQPDHSIRHLDLVNLGNVEVDKIIPELIELSPSERIYRALFLTSIQLLAEEEKDDSAPRYTLTEPAINVIKKTLTM